MVNQKATCGRLHEGRDVEVANGKVNEWDIRWYQKTLKMRKRRT